MRKQTQFPEGRVQLARVERREPSSPPGGSKQKPSALDFGGIRSELVATPLAPCTNYRRQSAQLCSSKITLLEASIKDLHCAVLPIYRPDALEATSTPAVYDVVWGSPLPKGAAVGTKLLPA